MLIGCLMDRKLSSIPVEYANVSMFIGIESPLS